MSGTFARPDLEAEGEDWGCVHCGDAVIRNYDGLGTGWSHIWPEGHPDHLRSGTKECRPSPPAADVAVLLSNRFLTESDPPTLPGVDAAIVAAEPGGLFGGDLP